MSFRLVQKSLNLNGLERPNGPHVSPISRRTNFISFEHNNVDQWGGKNVRNRILRILPYWVFSPKNAKIAQMKFQVSRLQVVIILQWLQMPKIYFQMIPDV